MNKTKLLALLLSIAFVGCAPLGAKSDKQGSATQGSSSSRTTGEAVDDATITAKIKTAFLADSEISGFKIDVDTNQGAVRLKGEVKTLAARKKAEAIARDVKGVKSVNNQLVITG